MVQEQCDILFARIEFPRYFQGFGNGPCDERYTRTQMAVAKTLASQVAQWHQLPTNASLFARKYRSCTHTHTHTYNPPFSLSRLTRLSLPSSSVAISSRRRVVKFPVRRIVRTSTLGTLWDRGGTRVPRILKSQSTLEKVATLSILVSLNYGGEGLSESWHEGNKMRSK